MYNIHTYYYYILAFYNIFHVYSKKHCSKSINIVVVNIIMVDMVIKDCGYKYKLLFVFTIGHWV